MFRLLSVFLVIFLIEYGDFMGIEVQAEQKPETLQIISDAFLEAYGEKYRPAQIYQYGTARYELQSLEQIKKEIPQKEQAVEETVQYTAVEQAEQLPETYHAWVKDQDTGVETEAELPVKDAEFTNWRWVDGFSLPITVQQYDAEVYYLGDQVVRAKEGDPFAAYGKELLKLAGLSPKYYKITSTRWEGGPWLGEDGYWYRKAEAEGEKYVADCEVIYGDVVMLPAESIQDYEVSYTLDGADAQVDYKVFCEGAGEISVQLLDAENKLVAEANGAESALCVQNAHLWQVRNAYLYTIVITLKKDGLPVDEYRERIGIRTVEIRGTKILINGKSVYLKGFGKHEDFDILGRGFNWAVAKRDFECMKWTDANCFRTSHYPYAEEWYQMADEEGFLIIDEVPAVGMMRSTHNFAAAGTGQYTYFFETPTVPELLKNHIQQVKEMMARDKNHPSVFAWSLFNEPETTSEYAKDYFTKVFETARTLDPQNRPLTGAFEKNSAPDKCRCYQLCDFICLNRYYGWYISGGAEMEEAEVKFRAEMDKWAAKKLNVPFVFTEFGTDTLATEHKLPAIMWSQEYQNEYLAMNFSVFDSYDFVQGELVWNFADFQTSEGVMRVNGNKKGIFTRQRQPKDAAFTFKKRWESLPLNYKGE